MTKKAFMIMTTEALTDLLRFYEKGVIIDNISNIDNDLIRFDLSGDGLPVKNGSLNEQVKTRHLRKLDGDGDMGALTAPIFAKSNDSFR